jgi:hypothetical protein
MDAALLIKLFGREQAWHGPCTVVVIADASVQAVAFDSVGGGGAKVYAPRVISGRIAADSACLLKDASALILMQQHKIRQATGEDTIKQVLTTVDPTRVVAVEFPDNTFLTIFGLTAPVIKSSGSHPGTHRPAYE